MAARKKSVKHKPPRKPLLDELSPHTRHAIAAVGFLVLGVFFALALVESAGLVGDWTKTALVWLLGTGAYAAPLVCGFYIYALMRPQEDEAISRAKVIGIGIGFMSLLGALELYHISSDGLVAGGSIGWLLATPLVYLFNVIAAAVIIGAIFLVSIFLVFDIGLRKPKPKEEPVEEDTS